MTPLTKYQSNEFVSPQTVYLAADVEMLREETIKELEMIEAMSMLTSDPLAYLEDIQRRARTILDRLKGMP